MTAPYPSIPSSSKPSTFLAPSARAPRAPTSWMKTKQPRANTARQAALRAETFPFFILGANLSKALDSRQHAVGLREGVARASSALGIRATKRYRIETSYFYLRWSGHWYEGMPGHWTLPGAHWLRAPRACYGRAQLCCQGISDEMGPDQGICGCDCAGGCRLLPRAGDQARRARSLRPESNRWYHGDREGHCAVQDLCEWGRGSRGELLF